MWLLWSKWTDFVAQLSWLTALHSVQYSPPLSLSPYIPFQNSPSVLLVNLLLSFKRCFGSVLQWTGRENKLMFMAKGNQTFRSYFLGVLKMAIIMWQLLKEKRGNWFRIGLKRLEELNITEKYTSLVNHETEGNKSSVTKIISLLNDLLSYNINKMKYF
jgi:hypothetical protein